MIKYTIVLATTNQGKIIEIKKFLSRLNGCKITTKSLDNYRINEPPEPYETFMENAIHKAKYYAQQTKEATFSDDSGLSIEALHGFPGVNSKKFIDESDGTANAFLILEKKLSEFTNYIAYMHCACALYIPEKDFLISQQAQTKGVISFPPKGDSGFGFDPIFIPDGHNQTFAELGTDIKTKISHRTLAMQNLVVKLQDFLSNAG